MLNARDRSRLELVNKQNYLRRFNLQDVNAIEPLGSSKKRLKKLKWKSSCTASNYSKLQQHAPYLLRLKKKILIHLHYRPTRGITLAHLRRIAPEHHRNVATVASLWRSVSDLTDSGIESKTYRSSAPFVANGSPPLRRFFVAIYCSPGSKSRRWTPPLVTRFGALPQV